MFIQASALWLDSRCQDTLHRPLGTLDEGFFFSGGGGVREVVAEA
jgi:hypothetical protein